MYSNLYLAPAVVAPCANDNDAFIPELWAREGLVILEENMVAARLVHRSFEDEVAEFGDIVNTRRPGEFKIRRKSDADNVVEQDAKATNVQVKLDQWFYNSFIIKDGEASKSFQELLGVYMLPAMQVIARSVDRAILGHIHQYLGTPADRAGALGGLTATNAKDYVLDARQILNQKKAHPSDRRLLLSAASETAMLKNELFIKANERGDGGDALENARLGRILGFDTFMDQNVNYMAPGSADIRTGTITNALAAGGGGAQPCTITGYVVTVGEYAVVAGNDQPTYITAEANGGGNTTSITLHESNKYSTAALAVVTVYEKWDVNGAHAVGKVGAVKVDGYTKPPQVGQIVAFGTGANRRVYTILEAEDAGGGVYDLHLDRPLEVALADNDPAFQGPAGSLNWAMHRDAIALVTRPLAAPREGVGALAAVLSHNGVGMRVVMQYDSKAQGTRVNMDILAGVKLLDAKLCVPLLG